MPRKTRKQKIISQKRKVNSSTPEIMVTMQSSPSQKIAPQKPIITRVMSESEKELRNHTIKDITKTIIIITLLFAAQAGVYFAQSKGLLDEFLH